jgi:hypothetical protein
MDSVRLTGSAVRGILAPQPRGGGYLAAPLPEVVYLGRAQPRARKSPIQIGTYLDIGIAAASNPDTLDWYTKAKAAIDRMYLNDQEGCCVISGKYHAIGAWTANDTGNTLIVSDSRVQAMYDRLKAGPGDSGCVITDVLDYMRSTGFPDDSGALHKIDGYAAADWTNRDLVKAALWRFGTLTLGINLPGAWTNSNIWDVTNTSVVGGHDVTALGYDDRGVYISSWGRIYLITWAAFLSKRWLEEVWVLLAPDWYNADKVSPSGFAFQALQDDLSKIGGGTTPNDDPAPAPAPPPGPAPDPTPTPARFNNLAFSTAYTNWRLVGGKWIADVAGTVKILS